jgi:hypothetical protein
MKNLKKMSVDTLEQLIRDIYAEISSRKIPTLILPSSQSKKATSRKSLIRQEIEEIIGREPTYCFIGSRKNGVRMKLGINKLTPKQNQAIMHLPHVVKVGYTNGNKTDYYNRGVFSGITIHFDCSTKLIKL